MSEPQGNPSEEKKGPEPEGRYEVVISIDCLSGGRVGFGCYGRGEGDFSEEAQAMLDALQKTINRFAHANGIPGFDCTKPTGEAS